MSFGPAISELPVSLQSSSHVPSPSPKTLYRQKSDRNGSSFLSLVESADSSGIGAEGDWSVPGGVGIAAVGVGTEADAVGEESGEGAGFDVVTIPPRRYAQPLR